MASSIFVFLMFFILFPTVLLIPSPFLFAAAIYSPSLISRHRWIRRYLYACVITVVGMLALWMIFVFPALDRIPAIPREHS